MEISTIEEPGRVCIKVIGRIDQRGADELKRSFKKLDLSSFAEVIFDFKEVPHIGSAGIGKMLLFERSVSEAGGRMLIENVSELVYYLITDLNLEGILKITRSPTE
ncbi:MAG: STAS domain-containing protein [Desulfobacterales bacterium]|nr:STAS domain-containing protein [Desulfobacterales bacterium]